jgi:hypothetical protein
MKAHLLRIHKSDTPVHVVVRSGNKTLFNVFLPAPLSISAATEEDVQIIGDFVEGEEE